MPLGIEEEFSGFSRVETDTMREGRTVTYTEITDPRQSAWNTTVVKVSRFGVTTKMSLSNSTSIHDLGANYTVLERAYREYEILDRCRGIVEGPLEGLESSLPALRGFDE